ncbi:hypothetical protein IAT38_000972 [Cryptococcus sp. DSM 104549]
MAQPSVAASVGSPGPGSPPPAYVQAPSAPQERMSKLQKPQPGFAAPAQASGSGSEASSSTAVDQTGRGNDNGLTAAGSNVDKNGSAQGTKTKYEQWYPGDASHDGRPAWWNRWFCCGYGVGCLLCPCGSWSCKHERS